MSRLARNVTTFKTGKHLHHTEIESIRSLRSSKSKKPEDSFNRGIMLSRKRKNTQYPDEPSSKLVRKSNATTSGTVKASQRPGTRKGNKYSTGRRHKAVSVKQVNIQPECNSTTKIRSVRKRKSNKIRLKSTTPSMKNKQIKTKRTSSKSTDEKTVQKSLPLKQTCSTEQTVTSYSLTKATTRQQNREPDEGNDTLFPSCKPSFRIVSNIKTKLKNLVTTIRCVDNNTIWIGRQVFGKLMKVKYQGNGKLKVLKQFEELDFVDFCFDREYHQLLYCGRTTAVMSISSNFEIKEMKCFKPLVPTCITLTSDNFIFVGLAQEYAYDCSDQPDPREIVKMDRNGTIYQRINSLENGTSKFMFVFRCAMNPVNNDLVVVGHLSSNKACVSNFNVEGKNGFSYFGQKASNLFTPRGLTCSSQGNIIFCNEYNGDIHILNKYGRLLHVLNMKSTGLPEKPWSLSWDFAGHLLIGTYTKKTGSILIVEYTDPANHDQYALV